MKEVPNHVLLLAFFLQFIRTWRQAKPSVLHEIRAHCSWLAHWLKHTSRKKSRSFSPQQQTLNPAQRTNASVSLWQLWFLNGSLLCAHQFFHMISASTFNYSDTVFYFFSSSITFMQIKYIHANQLHLCKFIQINGTELENFYFKHMRHSITYSRQPCNAVENQVCAMGSKILKICRRCLLKTSNLDPSAGPSPIFSLAVSSPKRILQTNIVPKTNAL